MQFATCDLDRESLKPFKCNEMAIELHFVRGDSSTPWGFRLTGGAEYDEPITVVKVVLK